MSDQTSIFNIGILTNPSSTYYQKNSKKKGKVKFNELLPETKMKKSTFPEFMDGGVTIAITLKQILSEVNKVEVALLIKSRWVITETNVLSPKDMEDRKINDISIQLKKWVKDKNILILLLKMNDLLELINNPIIQKRKVIICSTRTIEPKIRKHLTNLEMYCYRRGVAIIDYKNMNKIKEYLEELNER